MEDDRRTARKNRSRTALGGYKRHDVRGIKRTLTEGEGEGLSRLKLPVGLSLGGSGMASSASATFTFSSTSTSTSTSTGMGSGSVGGSAAVTKEMRNDGKTSRYFASNEAGPSTSTPNTKKDIDPDRTPTAVKLVTAPVPVPASSQQSATSQRSSQRKRPNSQTNRLGFLATKPSSQDIVIDNEKPLEPSQSPMKKKSSWNNARTSLLAEKRRRLSDHQKEEEAKRASAEGSGSGSNKLDMARPGSNAGSAVTNTIRAEEERSARPTWAVVNKSPASSDTEDDDENEDGRPGMASMAVVKQRMGRPRLLEEAFRRTKAVAVEEMEVDEVSRLTWMDYLEFGTEADGKRYVNFQ